MLVHICMFVHLYNFLLLRGWLGLPWQLLKVVILFVRPFFVSWRESELLASPSLSLSFHFPVILRYYVPIFCLKGSNRKVHTDTFMHVHMNVCARHFFQSHLISFILSFEHTHAYLRTQEERWNMSEHITSFAVVNGVWNVIIFLWGVTTRTTTNILTHTHTDTSDFIFMSCSPTHNANFFCLFLNPRKEKKIQHSHSTWAIF